MNPGSDTTAGESRPRSRARRYFRRCRIALLSGVLGIVIFALWCNFVRVPGFITSLVRDELRSRSIALEFSRLRLKGFRRLVAENVQVSSLNSTNGPLARIREAEILLNRQRLMEGEFVLSGVRVRGGEFELPLRDRAEPSTSILVTNIESEVDFLPGGTVRVAGLSASALGARATASGTLRHFSKLKLSGPSGEQNGGRWEDQAADILRIAEQLQFETPPEISLTFSADATNLVQGRATLVLRAEKTRSKWGALESLRLQSGVYPLASNTGLNAVFLFDLEGLRGISNRLDALHLSAGTTLSPDLNRLLSNQVALQLTNLQVPACSISFLDGRLLSIGADAGDSIATTLDLQAGPARFGPVRLGTNALSTSFTHTMPFSSPARLVEQFLSGRKTTPAAQTLSGEWRFRGTGVELPRVKGEVLDLSGRLSFDQNAAASNPALRWWADLAPFHLPWRGTLSNVVAQEIAVRSIDLAGDWNFPRFTLTNFEAQLLDGTVKASGALDVVTRQATLGLKSDFEYHGASALLDEPVQRWLTQFTWDSPPPLVSSMSLNLPPWDAEWRLRSLISSLRIEGSFDGPIRFREIPLNNVQSKFEFTNFVWSLPDLEIASDRGRASLRYTGNVTNSDFHCVIDSHLDPAGLRDLFSEEQQTVFDFVKFAQPPSIRGELWGNWEHPDRIGFAGEIAATNYFIKEQSFTDVRADVRYTNQIVECMNVVGHRGKEEVRAPYLRVDIPGEVMWVTNAISTIDPWVAMSLVGEDAYDAIDPYRFATTPTVTINGNVPLRHWSKANLHFGVSGQDFTFWRFHMPAISGDVYWRANFLNLSNVQARFYNGAARWSGSFVIDPDPKSKNAHYSFTAHTADSDLRLFMRDVFALTNQMEGIFSGDLVINDADSTSALSWNGYGNGTLRDGFLWNVPIFGIFSPILDSIMPGLGASRLNSGSGNFTITNSVIYTRDMQVRAPAFRLNYKGKVDLDGKLDARVEAEILRDAWVVGKLFSVALWPVAKAFEARVTGQLDNPKTSLRYFPKFVFAPFKALNAIGEAVREKPPKNAEGEAKSKDEGKTKPGAPAQP